MRAIGKKLFFAKVFVPWRDKQFPLRRMLNHAVNRTDLTCGQIKKFRRHMTHEICAADVCLSTKNTNNQYGNLDWNRIHWIYNMSAIDANKDGESINPEFLKAITGCKKDAMEFLKENRRNIKHTIQQGARQKEDGSRLGYVEFI